MYSPHTNTPVCIARNILCTISTTLKMPWSSIEDWIKVSSFPYIDKLHFHGLISVHQPKKPSVYACRQGKGTFWWKLA